MRGAGATADPAALRMHGAREVLAVTGGSARIVEQVEAIERSVADSLGFAFDLSKALIETYRDILAGFGDDEEDEEHPP